MFIAALFTITKIWKQPRHPSEDQWIKQLWDIYTMEYYLVVKKKKKEYFTLCDIMDGSGDHHTDLDVGLLEHWLQPVTS